MKKGMSSIIIIILILLITVSMIYISFNWLLPSSEQTQEEVEKSLINKNGCLLIENINTHNKKITLRNCGNDDLSNFVVYIDSKPFTQYSGKISAGRTESISFTEDLPLGNHEIYVSSNYAKSSQITFYVAFCNIFIYQSMIPYSITQSNKSYCLAEDVYSYGQNAINFSSGVQNSTLDCQDYNLDGNGNAYGVYLSGADTKSNTIKSCDITDFNKGIGLYSDKNTVANSKIRYGYNGIETNSSYSTIINNEINNNTNYGMYHYSILSSSNYNTITNNIFTNNTYGYYADVNVRNSIFNNNMANDNTWSGFFFGNGGIYNITIANSTANNNKQAGFDLEFDSYNLTLVNNMANNNKYGFYIEGSYNNTIIGNRISNNIYGIYLGDTHDNNIINGTINGNSGSFDYYLDYLVSSSSFRNTNFTDSRKIYFGNPYLFIYNNETTGNIWLKTNISTTTNITRKLINWSNVLMQWNDTSDLSITATYNITGLRSNKYYIIYNNTDAAYALKTDSSGNLPSFTIYLPASEQHNIKVQAIPDFCDIPIISFSSTYVINQNNTYYCLIENININGQNAINFSSVQNSTLDCQDYNLNGNDISSIYGIFLTGTNTRNNIIMNCKITNFGKGIYIYNLNYTTIINTNINSSYSDGLYLIKTYNNKIDNLTSTYNGGAGFYISDIHYSNLTNIITNYNNQGLAFEFSPGNSYNRLINITANNNYWEGIYIEDADNSNVFTNITANNNNDGFFIDLSDNNNFTNITVINNSYYGLYSYSHNNNFTNIISHNNSWGFYLYGGGSEQNNIISGGSIRDNREYDYEVEGSGSTHNFTETNFTGERKIRFRGSSKPWFNYNNQTTGNIWLKTNVSAPANITRKLTFWSQSLMQWNDTSDLNITATYNITGLIPNTLHYVYNNSVPTYIINSSSNGQINFTIYLPSSQKREIKINITYCGNPLYGDWIINNDLTCNCQGQQIIMNGRIFVQGSATFNITNCVVLTNESLGDQSPYDPALQVSGTARTNIKNTVFNTTVVGGNHYVMLMYFGSSSINYIENSTFDMCASGCNFGESTINTIKNSWFTRYIHVNGNTQMTFSNTTINNWHAGDSVTGTSIIKGNFTIGGIDEWYTPVLHQRFFPLIITNSLGIPISATVNITNKTNGALIWGPQSTSTGYIEPNITFGYNNYSAGNFILYAYSGTKINSTDISFYNSTPMYLALSPTTSSPIAEFNFNEAVGKIVHDSSGYGNDGTYYGETFNDGTSYSGSTPTDLHTASGKYGNALSFDGVIWNGDYLNVGNPPSLNLSSTGTVEAWIYHKISNSSNHDVFVGKDDWPNDWNGYNFWVDNTNRLGGQLANATKDMSIISNTVIQNYNWYHVAFVWNSTHMILYVNGTVDNTTVQTLTPKSDVWNFWIGGSPSWGGSYFNGTIDEVRVFNRSLSQAEINSEMQSSLPVVRPVSSYSFEESGSYANDTHIWVKGNNSAGLSFDGVNDYIDLGYKKFDYSNITVCAWIKTSEPADGADQRIVATGIENTVLNWTLTLNTSRYLVMSNSSAYHATARSDSVVNDDKWHYACGTTSPEQVYVDAVLQSSTDSESWGLSSNAKIGKGTTQYFNGTIDEVKIWNRTLTQAEIQTEMNS